MDEHNVPTTTTAEQQIGHPHDHGHDHTGPEAHDHESHENEHDHTQSALRTPHSTFRGLLPFGHRHSHSELSLDNALESSERGIWALKMSLVVLAVTALIQLIVAMLSGSVGLLADTIHNGSDAL